MQGILIFLLSTIAAIVYGIVHDQITTRICLEYFTVYHPPILGGTQDPTTLAFGWGIIATWWVGAILGIPLALAARVGSLPKRSAKVMIKPIAILLACMAACAVAAGVWAYVYCTARGVLYDPLEFGVPLTHQGAFIAVAAAHLTSYVSGFLGGITLIIWTFHSRLREHRRFSKSLEITPSL